MIDPQTDPQMVEWLTKFNVKVGNNIIVDKMSRLFGADYLMPLVATYTPPSHHHQFQHGLVLPLGPHRLGDR